MGAYDLLVGFFESRRHEDARHLAGTLTTAINRAILKHADHIAVPDGFSPIKDELMATMSVQPASLALPWQACYDANLTQRSGPPLPALESILATVPDSYRLNLKHPSDFSAPYHGSLMSQLADLITQAKEHLCVVNPYWSIQGVQQLERRVNFQGGVPKRMVVITPHEMSEDSKDGCNYFCQWIKDQGCKVIHYTPLKVPEGHYPLVHAKVVIADHNRAYLGSANLSNNGLVHSIEMGVMLQGAAAKHLSEWFSALSPYLNDGRFY